MDISTAIEPIKVEDVPTIIVDDELEPIIKLSGRRKRKLDNATKHFQFRLQQLAAKVKEVEELEQKLKRKLDDVVLQNSNINIKKPTFSSTQVLHPLNFIENLVNYLDTLPKMNRTIDTVIGCLEGDARNWAAIFKPRWNNVDDFIGDFLDQNWGKEDQSLLKKQILNGKWFWKSETMSRHFMCLVSQARWLTNKMSDDELIYEIMHHYPKHVQVAWRVTEKRTVLEAAEFLKKMDEIEVMCQGRKKMRQRQIVLMRYKLHSEKESLVYIPGNHGNNAEGSKKFKPE